MSEDQMEQMLNEGIVLDDGPVKFEKLLDEGGEGYNHWYRIIMKEGRNRVVRRTFEGLGLPVSRLMRVRFGIVNLPPRLKRGMLAELAAKEVNAMLAWVGMETHVAPQLSPRQIAASPGRGKLAKAHHHDKPRQTDKSNPNSPQGEKSPKNRYQIAKPNSAPATPQRGPRKRRV
jgi:23S rRNA pseudouridine2605 synthase